MHKQFQRAIELQQAGQFQDAEKICRRILKQHPRNAAVLHLLGVIAIGMQRHAEAVELIGRAISIDNQSPEFYCNLGIPLQQLGRFTEAIAAFSRAIELKPDFAEAFHNMGETLLRQEHIDQAISCFKLATSYKANYYQAHFNLANALMAKGMTEEAITAFGRAIELGNPAEKIAALLNLANLLHLSGRAAEAINTYGEIFKITTDDWRPYANMGTTLIELGRIDEAIAFLERAIAVNPSCVEAYSNLATIFHNRGFTEKAVEYSSKALAMQPNAVAYNNLGASYSDLKMADKAAECFRKAIELQPDFVDAYFNLGNIFLKRGEPHTALENYNKAIIFQPDHADAHWNRSLALLTLGDLEQGWEEYEWRMRQGPFHKGDVRPFPYPFWDGSSLEGKTILVWTEQGIGDDLLFASVIPDVVAACNHCVIETEHRLVSLYARSFPEAEVVPRLDPPHARTLQPDIQWQIPAGSLARFFRATTDSFPRHHGYLTPDPQRAAFWKDRINALGNGLKVGIAWRSRLSQKDRDVYYTELTGWGSILSIPGVTFVNLQYDECSEELIEAEQCFGIHIHDFDDIDHFNDLDEVAALTSALDLVIAPSISVACMAGALGIPVLKLTLSIDWSTLGTQAMPWFPDTQLFIKPMHGNWKPVIDGIAAELNRLSFDRSHQNLTGNKSA
ncbi:MAG: hypothetical protein A3J24_00665 [Deltaproteobacteria bacterium RIFCSPLOWO2_02_FULL_53_8]|nr:MAG: hypothetical protein A3J24_00665 [Deltaproteobacteria bacterium RIFCSPLOWO2_02_FULL_53_8]